MDASHRSDPPQHDHRDNTLLQIWYQDRLGTIKADLEIPDIAGLKVLRKHLPPPLPGTFSR